MIYRHRFIVRAPLEAVSKFHAQSSSMGAITPPPVVVHLHSAPDLLSEGSQMDFTLRLLFLPIRWVARIEQVAPGGFTDRQIKGPFAQWEHRHQFQVVDQGTTQVLDEVNAALSRHLGWWLVGLGMWISMPLLFAYRGWKTRRMLEV
jgi:ligand-binding SRPBCC domain-containing protein